MAAADAVIRKLKGRFQKTRPSGEVRNQARVHLWYPEKHRPPYPALRCSRQARSLYHQKNTPGSESAARKAVRGLRHPNGWTISPALIVAQSGPEFPRQIGRRRRRRWKSLQGKSQVVLGVEGRIVRCRHVMTKLFIRPRHSGWCIEPDLRRKFAHIGNLEIRGAVRHRPRRRCGRYRHHARDKLRPCAAAALLFFSKQCAAFPAYPAARERSSARTGVGPVQAPPCISSPPPCPSVRTRLIAAGPVDRGFDRACAVRPRRGPRTPEKQAMSWVSGARCSSASRPRRRRYRWW